MSPVLPATLPPPSASITLSDERLRHLADEIRSWARELGFTDARIADLDLCDAEPRLLQWLAQERHGQMNYMARHGEPPGSLRARPQQLVPGALRAICVRLDYLPPQILAACGDVPRRDWAERVLDKLDAPQQAVVSLYAHGRDYHKVVRARLQQLAERITTAIGPFGYRVFSDSAPVMEVELATKAGLGWRGKHTLLLNRDGGSMFFLGEILVNLPLPVDAPTDAHCGQCQACLDACPSGAIVAPYEVDARRCISYLTIELHGAIPENLRPLIGNRIYGCDDCQLVCPWNKFARISPLPDFAARNGLDAASLIELAAWSEEEFNRRMEGSAIRRIGYERWLRNLSVALGNALRTGPRLDLAMQRALRHTLNELASHSSPLVREHATWGLAQRAER